METLTEKEMAWRSVLREVKGVLDSMHIDFFLDCGTLLGCVRDNRFIPWDTDIDLGVIGRNCSLVRQVALGKALARKGFMTLRYDHVLHLEKDGVELTILIYRHDPRELRYYNFLCKYEGDLRFLKPYTFIRNRLLYMKSGRATALKNLKYTLGVSVVSAIHAIGMSRPITHLLARRLSCTEVRKTSVPEHFFSRFKTADFYGDCYFVPEQSSSYLSFRYGAWQNPVESYNYITDDQTLAGVQAN